MEFLQTIKGRIPDYAKDIRLNLDGTIARSSLEGNDAVGVALAAAFATKSKVLTDAIRNAGVLSPEEVNGALTAAALMGMNNVWYPYVEMADDSDLAQQKAELRMNAYANNGGVDKRRFEMYALAASIIGKCHFCIKSHYDLLKNHQGMSAQQLRDVGRIAAVINATAQVIAAE
ncbi:MULTISPECIES: carboxymuconolactone decarboxylase family protein [Ralstonia]|jgi:alkyl hydroperoxide reductase subunit D|uniref:Alkyl hydroperoxide reductase AhpD n=1 Tax=Ralstonia pickettii OR214 TaxID=1264675 RepID=R0EDM2_RALPI|nr:MULTISPECIES: carboxymuconolactone decarboxylase family protein [Ralstonia]MEA3269113.1 carboxymuconolactone decarboxylase family protein [Pseudomonadota bacterium]ENZ80154.1 alkylhydroperoxidase AhpD family core domain containing protein [Ralstonia pickettii OR214]MBL4776572.1 carboxymuconolactone decarboxylase family protein [Ralstonia sp.]MCM3582670.1 carboxymuconolactone decarboxylase family protein [Ralstonia pickettii]MDR9382838.1 carboxymuconolactone decarboxylase family protein [Ral